MLSSQMPGSAETAASWCSLGAGGITPGSCAATGRQFRVLRAAQRASGRPTSSTGCRLADRGKVECLL